MSHNEPTGIDIYRELEPEAEKQLNRHLKTASAWHPHDYIPYDEGKNYAALGGEDWSPEQSKLSSLAKAAMILNLLTEDNLPSYHREISDNLGRDGAWGEWLNQWTAEENRHSIVMRDYLVVTRGVDPVALENSRMAHMKNGYDSGGRDGLHTLSYVTFQELATRVSHRNTGIATGDPVADRMLQRIAKDENLHMIFYRNMGAAALNIAPNQTMRAITDEIKNFEMPGSDMDGFGRMGALIAKGNIYDPASHLNDVVKPVLKIWKTAEITGLNDDGAKAQDELYGDVLPKLETVSERFLANQARIAERKKQD